jgi:hypothetical protein
MKYQCDLCKLIFTYQPPQPEEMIAPIDPEQNGIRVYTFEIAERYAKCPALKCEHTRRHDPYRTNPASISFRATRVE